MSKIIIFIVIVALYIILYIIANNDRKAKRNSKASDLELEPIDTFTEPQLKPLTVEQIEDIHSRGKITPAEALEKWESIGLCAPGDAIGSAACRCKKFNSCHDCLVDYANQQEECMSFFEALKSTSINSSSQKKEYG